MDVDVRLVSFGVPHVEVLEPWFDDPETQARLGDRSWIRRAPSLLDLPVGEEFRGMITTGRHLWISLDEQDTPIGYVDAETYDRYAAWDGSDPDSPAISEVVELPSMGFALVIDPARRGKGYGAATIRAAIAHPDVSHVSSSAASGPITWLRSVAPNGPASDAASRSRTSRSCCTTRWNGNS